MSAWRALTDVEKARYDQVCHRCYTLRPMLNPEMTREYLAGAANLEAIGLMEKLLDRIDEQHNAILELGEQLDHFETKP